MHIPKIFSNFAAFYGAKSTLVWILQSNKYSTYMAKATIESVKQTEKAGLFSISFEGESYNEFEKFILKFKDDVTLSKDLQVILAAIQRMLETSGFLERYFRPEGKMRDNVVALPIQTGKLRLYCLRLSDSVLIVGNGGIKDSRTYNEDTELSGYVLTLQKLDELLKLAIKKGDITIEEHNISMDDNKTFDL